MSMRGCLLRVAVDADATEAVLALGASFGLERARRADWTAPDRGPDVETLRADVSAAAGDAIEQQLDEAARFVQRHRDALRAIGVHEGVRAFFLDFVWDFPPGTPARWGRFPHVLIDACATAGLELEVSVFATRPVVPG
jgi:hypothetical protein